MLLYPPSTETIFSSVSASSAAFAVTKGGGDVFPPNGGGGGGYTFGAVEYAVEAGAEPPGFPAGIDFSLLQSFGGERKAEKQWWQ